MLYLAFAELKGYAVAAAAAAAAATAAASACTMSIGVN